MAIKVSQAFERTSANPIDATIALTKAQMVAVNDNLMPDYYFTICQDDGYIYLYDKSATASAITGKFKKFEGGGGGGGGTAGSIYTGTLTSSGWNSSNQQTVTFTDYDNDYNGVVGVPSDATDAQKDAYKDAIISVVSQSGDTVTFKAETVPSINLPVAIYCGGGDGSGVPAGGTTGQALVKKSSTDGDVEWATINSIPTGGTTGQVLAKKSNTDRDVEWKNDNPGHTIKDSAAAALTQRANLQLKGVSITDDSTNNATVVETSGLNSDDWNDIIDSAEISNGYIQSGLNYSTNEQVIGKWVDGKPVYQKTVACGALPNSTNKIVNHNISNLDYIIEWTGSASDSTGIHIKFPYVNITTLGNSCNVWIDKTGIGIETASNLSNYTKSYVTIQYTKTTD